MHDAYIGGHFWQTKITRKASDAAAKPAIISSCSVLLPEIIMHGAYISVHSENNIKCVVEQNDLGRKNRTTQYNCRFSAASLALRVIFVCQKCPPIYASCMTISGGKTEQHIIIDFGEMAAIN